MLATARGQSRAFFVEGLIMNLRTKLAITGLGVAVLMLLAFLTPAEPAFVEQLQQIGSSQRG
jgi:hypothetical protein